VFSTQTSTLGVLSLLEPLRDFNKKVKFYQASSSEMYGGSETTVLNEDSLFDPKSPYAAGKVFAHNLNKLYRDSYNMFCVNGILFNHESPYRGETFVTRKISRAVGRIKLGLQKKLTLGNLEAMRDWGYAGDYVEGMWRMMQHDTPDDWVLATGKAYKVSDFAKSAFESADLNWETYITTSKRYQRPNEVHHLLGDSSKARDVLNWEPKVNFESLVKLMVEKDIELATQEKTLLDNGLIKPTWENAT
jgi:GDPmannose 4,6-dehydratase